MNNTELEKYDRPLSSRFNTKWARASKYVSLFVGLTSRFWALYMNKTKTHNIGKFLDLVKNRPDGKPLITVCNHDSCLDDPLVFGATLPIESFKNPNTKSFRWSLGAREVCHFNRIASLFFRLGKVCPIDRGRGVYQPIMNEIIEELNKGEWLHIFPEGKVNEEKKFLRLKWGVGRLIADAKVTPIVLPFYHLGMDSILPNKQPYRPLRNQKLTIVFGEEIYFDNLVDELKKKNKTATEIRKTITDVVQEEFYKLKKQAEILHEKHLQEVGT